MPELYCEEGNCKWNKDGECVCSEGELVEDFSDGGRVCFFYERCEGSMLLLLE